MGGHLAGPVSIGQALAQVEVTGLARAQDGAAGSGWEWFQEKGYGNGVRWLFVRGVTPKQIIGALGCDLAGAQPLAEEAAWDTFGDWARAGTAGGWGFSADSGSISVWDFERRARGLSAGTDLVLFQTGPDRDYFQYFADGIEVTAFEPLLARDRKGPIRTVSRRRCGGAAGGRRSRRVPGPGARVPGHADPRAGHQAAPGHCPRRASGRRTDR